MMTTRFPPQSSGPAGVSHQAYAKPVPRLCPTMYTTILVLSCLPYASSTNAKPQPELFSLPKPKSLCRRQAPAMPQLAWAAPTCLAVSLTADETLVNPQCQRFPSSYGPQRRRNNVPPADQAPPRTTIAAPPQRAYMRQHSSQGSPCSVTTRPLQNQGPAPTQCQRSLSSDGPHAPAAPPLRAGGHLHGRRASQAG